MDGDVRSLPRHGFLLSLLEVEGLLGMRVGSGYSLDFVGDEVLPFLPQDLAFLPRHFGRVDDLKVSVGLENVGILGLFLLNLNVLVVGRLSLTDFCNCLLP